MRSTSTALVVIAVLGSANAVDVTMRGIELKMSEILRPLSTQLFCMELKLNKLLGEATDGITSHKSCETSGPSSRSYSELGSVKALQLIKLMDDTRNDKVSE